MSQFAIYVTKLIGNGRSLGTAYRAAWLEILPQHVIKNSQVTDSRFFGFWCGELAVTKDQHDLLVADSRVRHIPKTMIDASIDTLTPLEQNFIIEIYNWLGLPATMYADSKAPLMNIFSRAANIEDWEKVNRRFIV